MGYYINCLKLSGSLKRDIKELVPDMNLRRRMDRVVKMSVSTAIDSLLDFEPYGNVDAIITATGLGCITNSEKFLDNIISAQEYMVNPTPFIQSTFNTVGAQIALIRSLYCYNNTFTNRYTSFESALIDAIIHLDSGKFKAVLVGVFDESTPTLETIMHRMRLLKNSKTVGDGSIFFILTKEQLSSSVAEIDAPLFKFKAGCYISTRDTNSSIWCGAVVETISKLIAEGKSGTIINDIDNKDNSIIKLKCL
ncbi:MAG: beta-ketoacyl synthase chain length factor [Rikenellaceae bacterium]